MLAPLKGRKALDLTPRDSSVWNHYSIEGFIVEPLIGDSRWNLSEVILGVTLFVCLYVEPPEQMKPLFLRACSKHVKNYKVE